MSDYIKEFAAHLKAFRKFLSYQWWMFAGKNAMVIVICETVVWLTLAAIMVYIAITVLFPLLR